MGLSMMAQIKTINEFELHGQKEYMFLYGHNERHTSLKRMFNEIKRIVKWLKM
mgnify:FL=1